MNYEKLGKNIVEQLLMENFTDKVSLYPGAFKPPHKGHVQIALDSFDSDTSKLILFVSSKSREDVEVEESLKAWELYKENTPGLENMEIISTPTPVKAVYDYVKDNPTHDIKAVFGKGEEDRFTSLATKYPNVEIFNAGTIGNYSATDLRKAIRDKDKEAIATFLPSGVNIDSFLSIFQIQEKLNEIGDLSQKPYDWKAEFDKSDEENDVYSFITDSGTKYEVNLYNSVGTRSVWDLEFLAQHGIRGMSSKQLTGGNEPLKIMSTIVDIVKSFIEYKGDVDSILYSPTKGKTGEEDAKDNTRAKLYKIIIQKNFPKAKISGTDDIEVDVSAYKGEDMFETIVGDEIHCDNCDWHWKIKEGGDDLYTCHKCWHDNTPKLKENKYLREARYKKYLKESWEPNKARVINQFMDYCTDYLSIDKPTIKLINSPEYTQQYHSFGGYVPSNNKLMVVVHNRNMADILRTIAHEMVHHMQNQDGRLEPTSGEDGSPDENEANSLAGVMMRQFGRNNPHIYE